jgi:alkylation response protein AidB-like acyl-CoA dehydrogenase
MARIIEAHIDATMILHEGGRIAQPNCWYGVWAAHSPNDDLTLTTSHGAFVLNGRKSFCTGAPMVDRALVTVRCPETVLIDVDLTAQHQRTSIDSACWLTPAFADTQTGDITFHDVKVEADDIIGPPNWYLERNGFWSGACGPAACWAGGAQGLIDMALSRFGQRTGDVINDIAIGELTALSELLTALVHQCAFRIDAPRADAAPFDASVALSLRHGIDRSCSEALDLCSRAMGPRGLIFDAIFQQRLLEVQLYARQCHGQHDLALLGSLVRLAGSR